MYLFGYGNFISSGGNLGFNLAKHFAALAGYQLASHLQVNRPPMRIGFRLTEKGALRRNRNLLLTRTTFWLSSFAVPGPRASALAPNQRMRVPHALLDMGSRTTTNPAVQQLGVPPIMTAPTMLGEPIPPNQRI